MDPLSTLQRLGQGRLIEELHQALVATAEEVRETGKPGAVTLTLKVSNAAQGEPMMVITDQITRKSPSKAPRSAFLYAVDGELHREDPRQTRMEFRAVDVTSGEIIEPTDHAPEIREVS